jgi:cytochrome c oxidase assembly factor 2
VFWKRCNLTNSYPRSAIQKLRKSSIVQCLYGVSQNVTNKCGCARLHLSTFKQRIMSVLRKISMARASSLHLVHFHFVTASTLHIPATSAPTLLTMPPILHPRSKSTSTLFTGTLAVSFLVVGLPHLLPCPANPRQFADTIEGPDGQPMRRRRKRKVVAEEGKEADEARKEALAERNKRECPVPKPGGLMGRVMGFREEHREKPMEVVVHELKGRRSGPGSGTTDDTP